MDNVSIAAKIFDYTVVFISGVGVWAFKFLRAEIKESRECAEGSREIIRHSVERLDVDIKELHEKTERQEQRILDGIKEIVSGLTPISHCNARQELQNEKFNNFLEMNSTQHEHIREAFTQVSAELSELRKCVTKLGQKKECD